jgi:hypothetical protein
MKRKAIVALILISAAAMTAHAQSSTGSSTPGAHPQVRPAFSQEQLPPTQGAALREQEEVNKARIDAKAQEERRLGRETRARGYWVDAATGLMWEGNDNGIVVTWHKATSYCRNLPLAGHSDWRLATLDELASLVDKSAPSSERVGNTEITSINLGDHVKGGLSLAGDPWSSTRDKDRFGHPYGDGGFFDFVTSKPSWDLQYFRNTKFALCVRRAVADPAPPLEGPAVANAQPSTEDESSAQETQARGYWVDPATGLMWAGRDNGKDVSWKKAAKYCRTLRLAAYSDWRLANIDELQGIYDKASDVPGLAGSGKDNLFTWHVKGNLFLTGDQWSSSQRTDDRGHPDGYAWYFNFNEGRSNDDPTGWPYSFVMMRALCVRDSRG